MSKPPPAPSSTALAPGTRVADFEVERVIGEGGFGAVYIGRDISLRRYVAVKVMQAKMTEDEVNHVIGTVRDLIKRNRR